MSERCACGYTLEDHAQIQKLRADLATERAIVKKWNCEMSKALAGSEYVNEPAAYVRVFQAKSDTIKEQAIEIRTERTARESLEKDRDGLAAALDEALTTLQGHEHNESFSWGDAERDVRKNYADIASILAAHDARLTEPLERRVAELLDLIRRMTKHMRTEKDYTVSEFEDYEVCKAGWRTALALTPREPVMKQMMIDEGGKIHEYCPDCRGVCRPYEEPTPRERSRITGYRSALAKIDRIAYEAKEDSAAVDHIEALLEVWKIAHGALTTGEPVEPPVDREQVAQI